MALACLLLAAPLARAQNARPGRLIDQPPYDVLTLDKANENRVLRVYPVNLPGRKVPEKPKSTDKLKVKLLSDGQEYEVTWKDVEKLELFEQLVLNEASQLTAAGKFDEAFDDFAFLIEFYPALPGLNEARQSYLYLAAGDAFKRQKYDEALGVLEELLKVNPNYRAGGNSPTLLQVLGNITDRIVAGYVERGDYRSARELLSRLAQQYKAEGEPFAQRGRQQLIDLASRRLDEAKAHLAAGRFVEAHDAAAAMQQIWPDLAGAAEVAAEIARRHPLVTVGVEHPALSFDSLSLHNVSARRAGRLTERLLVELASLGPEGGRYLSPYGAVSRSEDGLALIFKLPAGSGTGAATYDLAQRLLARAQPGNTEYEPAWSRIVAAVRAGGAGEVQVDLRLPHILPEALVQVPLRGAAGETASSLTPFRLLSRDAERLRLTANTEYRFKGPAQPAEVIERHFADPQRALLALKRGEVDLLDRVFPGDIAALSSDQSLVVAAYRAPTTHVLAIRSEDPYLANRNFRRALVYGSNREQLLKEGLLRGRTLPGFRLVSAPFPAEGELPAYGYDQTIQPREFDPRLAMTLKIVAQSELKNSHEKAKLAVPTLRPLVLGHPADETSRIACRGLVKQWKQIGIECSLIEFAPGVFDDSEKKDSEKKDSENKDSEKKDSAKKCDLVYLQLAAWEPLVDCSRLLATEGVAPAASRTIQQMLREIERSRNWQEARARLLNLHRLVHEEVSLIPLWQTMDHYAYRRTLTGLAADRLRLYQDIEQWRAAAQLAGTQP